MNVFIPDQTLVVYTLNHTCLRFHTPGLFSVRAVACIDSERYTPHLDGLARSYPERLLAGASVAVTHVYDGLLLLTESVIGPTAARLANIPRLLWITTQYACAWAQNTCWSLQQAIHVLELGFGLFAA